MDAANIDARASQGLVVNPIDTTIHQHFGLNADEIAALVGRLVDAMREAPQTHNTVAQARADLDNLRHGVGVLVEYKEVHDLLQRLELSHRIVYSLVCDRDIPLPAAQIRWRSLTASREALEDAVAMLCAYVESASFAADADWKDELRQAGAALHTAAEARNVLALVDLLEAIDQMVGRETSRFNDRLIGAVDALRISRWVQTLGQIRDDMPTWQTSGKEQGERTDLFDKDVHSLDALAAQLQTLRNTHDVWQQVDNALRAEESQLLGNVDRFKRRWRTHLLDKVRALVAGGDADWARGLERSIAQVETFLLGSVASDLADALHECRGVVLRRFAQIDFELRALCRALVKASEPVGALLEQLP